MADATCSEEGCDRPVLARGLCSRDYQRWRLHRPADWSEPLKERPKCLVGDCPREGRTKGYCNRHYEHLRLYGDPVAKKDRPLEVRLREVGWTVTESGCWEWDGKRNDNNYGLFSAKRFGYENARAHRAMYECFVEPIPDDLQLRHKCDNPPCVNPDHLIPGTAADNSRDMVERGRNWRKKRGGTCANGHDVTKPGALRKVTKAGKSETVCVECNRARQGRYQERLRQARPRRQSGKPSRLTAAQVTEIRAKRVAGVKLKALAAEYGISQSYACSIAKGSPVKRAA